MGTRATRADNNWAPSPTPQRLLSLPAVQKRHDRRSAAQLPSCVGPPLHSMVLLCQEPLHFILLSFVSFCFILFQFFLVINFSCQEVILWQWEEVDKVWRCGSQKPQFGPGSVSGWQGSSKPVVDDIPLQGQQNTEQGAWLFGLCSMCDFKSSVKMFRCVHYSEQWLTHSKFCGVLPVTSEKWLQWFFWKLLKAGYIILVDLQLHL